MSKILILIQNPPPLIFTHQPPSRREAGAGVAPPPSDERREVLQPSLLPVPDYSFQGGITQYTTSDHYCVSNGVRDGAGRAVKNNVKCYNTYDANNNLTAFNTYSASYLSGKPSFWLPSFFIKEVEVGQYSPPIR